MANSSDNSGTRRRVKLYMLNEDRLWDDRGTGHITSSYIERMKGTYLLVRSESDGSPLLESRVMPDTAYQKQQETLVVWSEAENCDLALSFQEKAGCDEIWEKICQVQGKDPSLDITQDIIEESEDEKIDELPDSAPPIDLPNCELSRLEEINDLFSSVMTSPLRREKLALVIERANYIPKLLDLFHVCEDLEDNSSLHILYEIFKSIFVLNKNSLFEIMFGEDHLMDVVGVLEYDPSVPSRVNHRDFLLQKAHFKEVIPFNNAELIQKIHQTYRVQYIQDVMLPAPSVFEENLLSALVSFLYYSKGEIVQILQDDDNFLHTLFSQLTDDETDEAKRKDLVGLLKEFCTYSHNLQPQQRDSFFKTLKSMGILGALEIILGLDDLEIKSCAIDIFSYIVEFSPSLVREFLVQEGQRQDDDDLLINLVIEHMKSDSDPELGGAFQLNGILRLLIDPENMMATSNKAEKTEFLSFFYKHSMSVLTAPLFANTADGFPSKDDYRTALLLTIILELLTFCIEHHTYHIKNYVLNKDLLRRVLVLLHSKHAFMVLAALRLLRKIISKKDEFYNRYVIKGNLLQPVIEAFRANGNKYNLLNSAMIELFEFIGVEDIKSMVAYIAENHIKSFEDIDYVQTFKSLKVRYEQQQDRLRNSLDGSLANRNTRWRKEARAVEEEETLWFDQEDEMEDTSSAGTPELNHENDLDPINALFEPRKSLSPKDPDLIEHAPKLALQRSISISLKDSSSLKTSPSNVVTSTPCPSPVSSPIKSSSTATSPQQRKVALQGLLVDYDEDSEEEEEDDDGDMPSVKRARLST